MSIVGEASRAAAEFRKHNLYYPGYFILGYKTALMLDVEGRGMFGASAWDAEVHRTSRLTQLLGATVVVDPDVAERVTCSAMDPLFQAMRSGAK